jgi:hypothetical protein
MLQRPQDDHGVVVWRGRRRERERRKGAAPAAVANGRCDGGRREPWRR